MSSINTELNSLSKSQKTKKRELTESEKNKFDKKLQEIINESKKNLFHKKEFEVDGVTEQKTIVYQFFDSKTEIKHKEEIIDFCCIVCHGILSEPFNKSSNLTSHLKQHDKETDKRLTIWFENWKNSKVETNNDGIDENLLIFTKYILSSNTAMVHIDNIYLKELLKKAGITVCSKTVKNTILPEMVKKVKITLEEKLNKV